MADSGTFTSLPPDRPWVLLAATLEPSSSAAIEALPSVGIGLVIRGSFAAAVDWASSSAANRGSSSIAAIACPLAVDHHTPSTVDHSPLPSAAITAWPSLASQCSTCSHWLVRAIVLGGPSSFASGRSSEPSLTLSDTNRRSSYSNKFCWNATFFIYYIDHQI